MARPVNMPQVGQDIETAVISKWKVQEGDLVHIGDVIALVESDKAVFEVEAFERGTVLKRLYKEGEEGKVFEPIAYIGESDEVLFEKKSGEEKKQELNDIDFEKRQCEKNPTIAANRIFASPSARRLARQNEINLATLTGSGPNGRIVKEDILGVVKESNLLRHGQQPKTSNEQIISQENQTEKAGKNDQVIKFTKMRQKIADRLTSSWQTIPHFYLSRDLDISAALVWRKVFNETSEVKITINDLIVKAVAASLIKYPQLNAHVFSDRIILKSEINIGVAVSVDEGLIVPVIEKTDQKSLVDINRSISNLIQNIRSGIQKWSATGTFTISNLGMYGVSRFMPIINPPECAILGVGAAEKKIVTLTQNSFAARDIITLTLACDHRATDGVYAAMFLNDLKDFIEKFGL